MFFDSNFVKAWIRTPCRKFLGTPLTASTSYYSFALLLALFQVVLQLPLLTLFTNRLDYFLSLYSGLPSLPWPYSALCITPYWPNTKVQSRNRLHVGGTELAPCPTAHSIQGCLLGVVVPVRHCSNLPNWSVLICGGYYEWSLPTLCGKNGPLSPVSSYHSHASPCFLC